MMKNTKYWGWIKIVDIILPIAIISSVIEFYLELWYIDTFLKIVSFLVSFVILIKTAKPNSSFSSFFSFYIIYCLLTGVSYLYNGRPFSCYFSDISDFILPMLFVYVGLVDDRTDRKYYNYFLNTLIIILLLGLIPYLSGSGWYMSRMADIRNSEWFIDADMYDEDSILGALRYCAFFKTSYPISHFATFALSLILFDLLRQDKDVKYTIPKLFIVLVSIVLSQHRVAIACGVLFILITVYYAFRNNKISRILPIIILLALGAIAVIVIGVINGRFEILFDMLSKRFNNMSLSSALKERKQIAEVFSSWNNVITGQGIGSGGASARRAGFYGITDQNYAKLLYETGLIGCVLYALMIIPTLFRAFKYFRYYAAEFYIITFISIAMMGSNSLVIYYMYIVTFWYAVGRVWNKQYLNNARQLKICI